MQIYTAKTDPLLGYKTVDGTVLNDIGGDIDLTEITAINVSNRTDGLQRLYKDNKLIKSLNLNNLVSVQGNAVFSEIVSGCDNLEQIDIRNLTAENVGATSLQEMFNGFNPKQCMVYMDGITIAEARTLGFPWGCTTDNVIFYFTPDIDLTGFTYYIDENHNTVITGSTNDSIVNGVLPKIYYVASEA